MGFFVPFLAPLVLVILGKIRKNSYLENAGFAIAQSAILGSLISSFYKAITGRAHPALSQLVSEDITHIFKFGFLRAGVFWGWPSSHTTIAFAMAFALIALYPKNTKVKILSVIYALYIGIGVSVTIHWFSDFVAGAIIGAVIGTVVGAAFATKVSRLA